MSESAVAVELREPTGVDGGELLVLGHSLGTSAGLWDDALPSLERRFRVVRWELPGHGSAAPARSAYRVEDLTDAVISQLDEMSVPFFHYAGVSIGGCVGLDLGLRHPARVASATVISSGARVDDPRLMRARADTVRGGGVGRLVEGFRPRWFASTTPPATVERVLAILAATDAESYALAALALADFDVWDQLGDIETPILAMGGDQDASVPFRASHELAARVPRGTAIEINDAAHSVVAEQPEAVAEAIIAFASSVPAADAAACQPGDGGIFSRSPTEGC